MDYRDYRRRVEASEAPSTPETVTLTTRVVVVAHNLMLHEAQSFRSAAWAIEKVAQEAAAEAAKEARRQMHEQLAAWVGGKA